MGALAAVICLSSTSVMAPRKHKTNPARETGRERGKPADYLRISGVGGGRVVLNKEVRNQKWWRI